MQELQTLSIFNKQKEFQLNGFDGFLRPLNFCIKLSCDSKGNIYALCLLQFYHSFNQFMLILDQHQKIISTNSSFKHLLEELGLETDSIKMSDISSTISSYLNMISIAKLGIGSVDRKVPPRVFALWREYLAEALAPYEGQEIIHFLEMKFPTTNKTTPIFCAFLKTGLMHLGSTPYFRLIFNIEKGQQNQPPTPALKESSKKTNELPNLSVFTSDDSVPKRAMATDDALNFNNVHASGRLLSTLTKTKQSYNQNLRFDSTHNAVDFGKIVEAVRNISLAKDFDQGFSDLNQSIQNKQVIEQIPPLLIPNLGFMSTNLLQHQAQARTSITNSNLSFPINKSPTDTKSSHLISINQHQALISPTDSNKKLNKEENTPSGNLPSSSGVEIMPIERCATSPEKGCDHFQEI